MSENLRPTYSPDQGGKSSFISIAESDDPDKASLWSLVLLSTGFPHEIRRRDAVWQIFVKDNLAGAASNELAQFEEENADWPSADFESVSTEKTAPPPTIPLVVALVVFHQFTGPWSWKNPWFELGAISRQEVVEKLQLWRLVTALTLHADAAHLLGNCFFGGIIVHLLCLEVGTGLGWSLVFLSGILGNAVNVLARSGQHFSVGFSTSVFGAVGALCGLRIKRGLGLKGLIAPLGGGAALLAMLGASGEKTDLGAHFWGLLSGLLLVIVLLPTSFLEKWRTNTAVKLLPLFWLAFVFFAWLGAYSYR